MGGAMGGIAGGATGGSAGGATGGTGGGASGDGGTGASGAGGAGTAGSAGATGGAIATGGARGAGGAGGTVPFYPLDMNDVTILAPLPKSAATPVLLLGSDLAEDGTALVPRALFDHLVTDPKTGMPLGLVNTVYDQLQLVAVRFDLCDRHLPGDCPAAEDARMRLVFQPIQDSSAAVAAAMDISFHLFTTIRNDEIAGAVAALRDLAMIAPPQTGALRVSPALSAADPTAYATKLRAFVRRYGGDTRIVRLTMNAQNFMFEASVWMLRGVEKQGTAFADMTIVGTTAIAEQVVLNGNPSFDVTPAADTPSGLLGAITQKPFDAADATQKQAYLAVLAAVDNPLSHTAETVPCVSCHVSTVVMSMRAASAAIDPLTLPGRYTSKFDVSISGGQSAQSFSTLRALGYLRMQPMISQRVANDTAQVLTEIEARYPPP